MPTVVTASRAVGLVGVAVSGSDAFEALWTQEPDGARAAGIGLAAAAGMRLRLWSALALAGAFSYDLNVGVGQDLAWRRAALLNPE